MSSDPKCKIDAFCASSAGCPYKVFVITDMMSLRKKSVLKMDFFDTRETSSVSWLFRVKCIEVKKRKLTQMVRHNRMNETECAATYPPLHFCVTKIKLTPRKKKSYSDHVMMQGLKNWRIIDAHFSHLLWMIVRTFFQCFLSSYSRFSTPKKFHCRNLTQL